MTDRALVPFGVTATTGPLGGLPEDLVCSPLRLAPSRRRCSHSADLACGCPLVQPPASRLRPRAPEQGGEINVRVPLLGGPGTQGDRKVHERKSKRLSFRREVHWGGQAR